MSVELSKSESAILDRFREKCRIAGGAKAGYLLRLDNIRLLDDPGAGVSVDRGLEGLAARDLVKPTEKGDRYYLTEEGARLLEGAPPAAG